MSHVHHRLLYHFVWSTWDREPLLVGAIEREAYALIQSACGQCRAEVHALGGVADHIHLLVTLPRTVLIPDFMEVIKGMSSKALNDVLWNKILVVQMARRVWGRYHLTWPSSPCP